MADCRRALIVFALFFITEQSSALTPNQSIDQLASRYEWIFVGTVETIGKEPSLYDAEGPLTKIQIKVTNVFCGKPNALGLKPGRLEFLYNLNFLERPRFAVGRDFVFFWQSDENGPRLAPEFYGALPVQDDEVDVTIFAGHAQREKIDHLRKRIHCKS